jgi:hypothetical protein
MKIFLLFVMTCVCLLGQDIEREKLVRLQAVESGVDQAIMAVEVDHLVRITKAYADYIGRIDGAELDKALGQYSGAIYYPFITPKQYLRKYIDAMPEYLVIAKAGTELKLRRENAEKAKGPEAKEDAVEVARLKKEHQVQMDAFLAKNHDGEEYDAVVGAMTALGFIPAPIKPYDNLSDIPKELHATYKRQGMTDREILENMGIVSVPAKGDVENYHLEVDQQKKVRLKRIKK